MKRPAIFFQVLFLSTAFSIVFSIGPASSLPNIPVKVEVGLDDGTKQLLDALPTKLHDAFIDAANKSLDRLDFSVQTYVTELKKAASATTQDVACTTQGVLLNTEADLIRGVNTLLFGDSFNWGRSGDILTPPSVDSSSQVLLKNIDTGQKVMKGDTRAVLVFAVYSDLATQAARLICKQQSLKAPTTFGEYELGLMRRAIGEWQILTAIDNCANPDDCLARRRSAIDKLISTEDPKLIEAASAKDALSELNRKDQDTGAVQSVWQATFERLRGMVGLPQSPDYNISQTENVLFGLRDVELNIAAIKANWQWQAAQHWTSAQSAMNPLPQFLSGIAGEMNPGASGYNLVIDSSNAFNNLRRTKTAILAARTELAAVKPLDPRLDGAADAGMKELDILEKDAMAKVEQICGIYLAPHGLFHFNNGFGAFNWCNANKTNRWALYPTFP